MKIYTVIFLTAILILTVSTAAIAQQADDIISRAAQIKSANTPPKADTRETDFGIPENDMLAAARVLTLNGNSASVGGGNFSATKEANEPNHAENPGGKSVWFSFTPQATVMARIRTEQNDFDTLLAVYQGENVGSLSRVGSNDDCSSSCGTGSLVDLMLVGGQTYRIAVDGYSNGSVVAQGSFQLTLTTFNAPPQNDFANAYNLGITPNSIAGTNYLATRETSEPEHYNQTYPGAKSVWYKWMPLTTFSASVELTENFDSVLSVYTANVGNPNVGQLNKIRSNIDNQGFTNANYSVKFLAEASKTYYIAVSAKNFAPDEGNFQLRISLNRFRYSLAHTSLNDKTPLTVFRPSSGIWYTLPSVSQQIPEFTRWGINGDTPVAADYDGNGISNLAVTRAEGNQKMWYIRSVGAFQWGAANDREAVGDFNRDGIADSVAIRQTPNGLVWYVRQSGNGTLRSFLWGANADRFVLGDFDGDGATDVAVTRSEASGLVWYILKSGYNQQSASYTQSEVRHFGVASDTTVVEDYDGDGKTDCAVFRSWLGTWYILRSSDNQLQAMQFGAASDRPQPADYNGDGRAEPVVFRPSTGTWYTSTNPAVNYGAIQWGAATDVLASSLTTLSQ